MKFLDFYKKYEKEVLEQLPNPFGSENTEERAFRTWLVHHTIETNKKLIWATWALAIASIILSGLTLYFQFFNE